MSFDMGGTTAKMCLVDRGWPSRVHELEAGRVRRFRKGSGLPLKVPVVDMIEIGAGGGSIARVDAMGLLKVGPQSAGSEPGPVGYGRGGTLPTVTDADLVLGYLSPDYFLGGELTLDRAAVEPAIEGHIARPPGLDEAGADPAELTLRRTADMRYVGQGFEIPVPLPEGPLGPSSLDDLKERFLATYAQLFERRITDMPIEAMSWRLAATAPVPNVELNFGGQPARHGDARKGTRQVYLPQTGLAPCAVYHRYSLTAGTQLSGH